MPPSLVNFKWPSSLTIQQYLRFRKENRGLRTTPQEMLAPMPWPLELEAIVLRREMAKGLICILLIVCIWGITVHLTPPIKVLQNHFSKWQRGRSKNLVHSKRWRPNRLPRIPSVWANWVSNGLNNRKLMLEIQVKGETLSFRNWRITKTC